MRCPFCKEEMQIMDKNTNLCFDCKVLTMDNDWFNGDKIPQEEFERLLKLKAFW